MQKMSEASGEMKQLASDSGGGTDKKTVVVEDHNLIPAFLYTQTPDIVASGITLLILLYFLLGYKGVFLNKLVKVIPRFRDKKLAVTIASDIEKKISYYLTTVTFINLGLGCAIAIAMYFLGLPNPILWGVAAATLNFVPYLGPFTGILAMTIAAILTIQQRCSRARVFPRHLSFLCDHRGKLHHPHAIGPLPHPQPRRHPHLPHVLGMALGHRRRDPGRPLAGHHENPLRPHRAPLPAGGIYQRLGALIRRKAALSQFNCSTTITFPVFWGGIFARFNGTHIESRPLAAA